MRSSAVAFERLRGVSLTFTSFQKAVCPFFNVRKRTYTEPLAVLQAITLLLDMLCKNEGITGNLVPRVSHLSASFSLQGGVGG